MSYAAGGGHVQGKASLAATRRMNSLRGNKIVVAFSSLIISVLKNKQQVILLFSHIYSFIA